MFDRGSTVSSGTQKGTLSHLHLELEIGAEGAFFVTDNRFDHGPLDLVPGARIVGSPLVLEITRGGRWVRRFQIFELRSR